MLNKTLLNAFLASVLLGVTACQNGILENVRKVTYPPDFNYISKDKLTNTMQTFAWYIKLLDNNLRNTSTITNEQLSNSISLLGKMEKLSHELGTESLSSNHNIVSFNIDAFRQKIVDARKGLLHTPPNYYLVGALSGSCINCHSLR